MGTWDFYAHPSEPPYADDREEEIYDAMERGMELASLDDFIEQEMSYEDAMAKDIATDEEGWGAWMGGEL